MNSTHSSALEGVSFYVFELTASISTSLSVVFAGVLRVGGLLLNISYLWFSIGYLLAFGGSTRGGASRRSGLLDRAFVVGDVETHF